LNGFGEAGNCLGGHDIHTVILGQQVSLGIDGIADESVRNHPDDYIETIVMLQALVERDIGAVG
jgi:hypothetical protein